MWLKLRLFFLLPLWVALCVCGVLMLCLLHEGVLGIGVCLMSAHLGLCLTSALWECTGPSVGMGLVRSAGTYPIAIGRFDSILEKMSNKTLSLFFMAETRSSDIQMSAIVTRANLICT